MVASTPLLEEHHQLYPQEVFNPADAGNIISITDKKPGNSDQNKPEDNYFIVSKIFEPLKERYRRVPPRYRYLFFLIWVFWKFVAFFLVVYFVTPVPQDHRSSSTLNQQHNEPLRVLYTVTSLAEYNNGKRSTKAGQDRLKEVMLPILVDSLESIKEAGYHVDAYLILAYKLRPEREDMVRQALPAGVGLQIWDEACPLGYDKKHDESHILNNTRALARQHRYVFKDKLTDYDIFMAWEDDMRITGHHLDHFMEMTTLIDDLRREAPTELPAEDMSPLNMTFHGPISRRQADRLVPGFVRVEVLLNEKENGAQTILDPVRQDFMFDGLEHHFDPHVCCHVKMNPNIETPVHPKSSDVIIWETNIRAISVRQLPTKNKDWVALLPGPGKKLKTEDMLGGYWSGRQGAFGDEEKPSGGRPDIIAQQGGYMVTREQIMRLNNLCQGNFLPPFDEPIYKMDGQGGMNVEFWSGGYQFFTGVRGGCNMQRIMSLDPDKYSRHFIYHVANNKQKQLHRERMLRADTLMGQINTVVKMANHELSLKG